MWSGLKPRVRSLESIKRYLQVHDAEHASLKLRYLDEAVAGGSGDRIQAAVGAAMASDHLHNARRVEPHLAQALNQISAESMRAATAETTARLVSRS